MERATRMKIGRWRNDSKKTQILTMNVAYCRPQNQAVYYHSWIIIKLVAMIIIISPIPVWRAHSGIFSMRGLSTLAQPRRIAHPINRPRRERRNASVDAPKAIVGTGISVPSSTIPVYTPNNPVLVFDDSSSTSLSSCPLFVALSFFLMPFWKK